jgi:signal transduction histidine kinase
MSSREGATCQLACPVGALHDSVIQRLFAAALHLQSALGRITDPAARQCVRQSVDVLDEVIGDVRATLHDR